MKKITQTARAPRLLAATIAAAAVVLATAPASTTRAAPAGGPVAKTEQGQLQGLAVDGGFSFRKIPFAKPPVGALRWRLPEAPMPWKGVRDATTLGLPCAQPDLGWNGIKDIGSSEDCLTLNVWTQSLTAKPGMPVMVWIHGGAFEGGSGVEPTFDGAAFMRRGVVLVTINYRLGVLGFLTHPDLDKESPHHTSGDYGFYDQIAALRWVHKNISRFGGDPRRVTIFGQSAGSASVASLMTSPLAKDLFAQSIMESGAPIGIGALKTTAETEATAREWGSIAEMRKLSADDVLASWRKFAAAKPAERRAMPVVDGVVITASPDIAFATGIVRPMPSIIGNNAREAMPMPMSSADAMQRAFGTNADKAAVLYDKTAPADPVLGDAAAQFATDTSFRCPTVMTQTFRAQGGNAVYGYQFEQSLPGKEAMGAAHSFELPFVFGNLNANGFLGGNFSQGDRELSDQMQAYWSNFAKTGNPNSAGLPPWERFEADAPYYMVFADGRVGLHKGLRADVCALYRAHWLEEHPLAMKPASAPSH